ncbi:MAG TPA: class I SAM-dependent methyltransferase [Paludibacter sp.]|nr:class I SAM-dependent methyltransferase [Paludibacter sp.]
MKEDNFAGRAAGWDNPEKLRMTRKFVDEMLLHVTPHAGSKALEIGAGTGLVGLCIEPMVGQVVYEDTSGAMLGVLENKLPENSNAVIFHGEVQEYIQQDIDLVFSCMAFHHIPDIDGLLKHLAAITNPNAVVVVGDLMSEDGSFHNFEPIPHPGFDVAGLSGQFSQAGFLVLTAHQYNILTKESVDGKIREYGQFILVARKK